MGWGDEIMVTGIARRLQERNPAPVRVHDKRGRVRWSEVWNGNPRFAPPHFKGRVQVVVNGPSRRPYVDRETAECWHWRDDWICPIGEIYFSAQERAFGMRHAGKVILEPGQVSGLIQIENAYTIVRATAYTPARKQPFAEVKAGLKDELQKAKYERLRSGLAKRAS